MSDSVCQSVIESLENRGVLNDIRANIKAEIILALEKEKPRHDSHPRHPKTDKINQLIYDYLIYMGYGQTLRVMTMECGLPTDESASTVDEIKKSADPSKPALISLVEKFDSDEFSDRPFNDPDFAVNGIGCKDNLKGGYQSILNMDVNSFTCIHNIRHKQQNVIAGARSRGLLVEEISRANNKEDVLNALSAHIYNGFNLIHAANLNSPERRVDIYSSSNLGAKRTMALSMSRGSFSCSNEAMTESYTFHKTTGCCRIWDNIPAKEKAKLDEHSLILKLRQMFNATYTPTEDVIRTSSLPPQIEKHLQSFVTVPEIIINSKPYSTLTTCIIIYDNLQEKFIYDYSNLITGKSFRVTV